MKILQIAPCYVDIYNETGGVANIVRQICLKLEKNRINTVLICSNTELGKTVARSGKIEYSDYLTIYVVKQYKNPLLGPTKKLHSILKLFDGISLAHIHTCFSAITEYSMKYLTGKNIPCIFTPHGKLSPSMYSNNKLFKDLYFRIKSKRNLNHVNSIVASSSNEINYMKALGINGQFSYIHNGYSHFDSIETHQNYWKLDSKSYLLFLGYLDPRKQPDLLIQAFSKSMARKNFKLVLAGPDLYGFRKTLEKLVKSENLEINKHVIFTDRVEGEAKWDLLKNAKGLFLSSKGEGWPVVIAEAIGAKIPCVISKECNFSEINQLQLGIEVSDFKIENWTSAIDQICSNKEQNVRFEINLNKFAEQFSWDSITNEWISKYKTMLNEART